MLPEISVELLGPIRNLRGRQWPRGYDWGGDKPNQPLSQILADEPHELVIHLPAGRTIRHISNATFLTQKRGTVDDASLMPHPGLLKYQDAINLLELILENWNAEPDERTKQSLAKWKTEGDLQPWELARRDGSATLLGENRVAISFQIRPRKPGWYLVIDVAATLDEERKFWGSAQQPATSRAATRPSDGSR